MFGMGVRTRQYFSKIKGPANSAVVMLGAGASAQLGGPLVRGFIDLAKDGLQQGQFSDDENWAINDTLKLYGNLREKFLLTEEDIDNIETLISFSDLSSLVSTNSSKKLFSGEISNSVRQFVDLILTKNIIVPSVSSCQWANTREGISVKKLVAAQGYYQDRLSVISLNYDCILEYASHSMGLGFTYNRKMGTGSEILKLHGSLNWLKCSREHCWIEPLAYSNLDSKDFENGILSRKGNQCSQCEKPGIPIIVPPTWSKEIPKEILKNTWSQALEALEKAECFVSIGYSLPIGDQHVRNLLHLGFSSGKLRQAVIIVGNDKLAADRWETFFRPWWRQGRLKIVQTNFEAMAIDDFYAGLGIPETELKNVSQSLLPLASDSLESDQSMTEKLHSNVDWGEVQKQLRKGAENENVRILNEIIGDWKPSGEILPTHGQNLGLTS